MTGFTDVTLTIADGIARLTVVRPERLNALREATVEEMRVALRLAEADPTVGCLVLGGQGRAFGAGYDLSTVTSEALAALDDVLERHFNPLVAAMRASRLPIVAAVAGPCAGASVGVAAACDLVIATREAYFFEPFVGLALVPDAGNTVFLTRLFGRGRATAAMLLGERISAAQAERWGLVWQVCEPGDFDEAVDRVATRLAGLPARAVAATKRLIREACEADLADRLAAERDLQGIAGRDGTAMAAIDRFFATRRG